MIPMRRILMLPALCVTANISAFAHPNFLEAYIADKFAKTKDVGCNFCHLSPTGGDARNVFGRTFEAGGEDLTPILRAQFPERFTYPMLKVSDTLTIHFSDPANKIVIVESNGTNVAVDVENKTVDGKPATPGGNIALLMPTHPVGGPFVKQRDLAARGTSRHR